MGTKKNMLLKALLLLACVAGAASEAICSADAAAQYYSTTNLCGGKDRAKNAFCSKCDVGNQKAYCCTCDVNCPDKDNMCGKKTCVPGANRVACKHCDVKDAPDTRVIETGDGTTLETDRQCTYEMIGVHRRLFR